MATETEIKMRVADLAAIRDRLRDAGARPRSARFELNVFFDTIDGSLRAAGRGLRLRSMTDEQGSTTHVITFKGPRSAGAVSSREEIEFSVGDVDDAAALLDRLGHRRTLGFEKRRETWSLGGCLVELDELPHLGTFVEIEGDDEASVLTARSLLTLDDTPTISKGYISMIDALVRERPPLGPIVQFDVAPGANP